MSKRNKHSKINILKILLVVLILFIGVFLIYKLVSINESEKNNPKITLMPNLTNMDINVAKKTLESYQLTIELTYDYSDTIAKDKIITQSIKPTTEIKNNDPLTITVSLGKIDKEKFATDGINELGKVPIMMYHGIKNMKNSETSNTGGNVDKDGYTRTAEAFRADLDFYYQEGYRMIKLSDYIDGNISVPYGKSPIVLTFDDGNDNNIKVTGIDSEGNIIIDKNSAVGILEEYKQKYPDFGVTAIFFVTGALFNQPEYNEKILTWLVENGYEVGNHTKGHNNFTKIDTATTEEVVGYVYDKLDTIIPGKYSKIVALPFGTPYKKTHENYSHILTSTYNGKTYETIAALRVGWEPEVSPYNKDFDKEFMKRCRAYDNNGKEFDIDMVFNNILKKHRYISDGNADTVVTPKANSSLVNESLNKKVILY